MKFLAFNIINAHRQSGVSWVSTEGAANKTLDDVHCIRDWYVYLR